MEFTEIWLRGTACLVNAEHKQANKCFGIFNRLLIAFNIEQMNIISGIPDTNSATVSREKVQTTGRLTWIFAFVYTNFGCIGSVSRWEKVVLICSFN